MLVLVIRGSSGAVVWDRIQTGTTTAKWVCQRDAFAVPAPTNATEAQNALLAISNHSQQFTTSIAQVVELEL